jgi:hypothetical protein
MGVIEDVRKVLQDFLAPELRAINARLDAMEKVDEARHSEVLARIDSVAAQIDNLKVAFALDRRVERLENRDVRTS